MLFLSLSRVRREKWKNSSSTLKFYYLVNEKSAPLKNSKNLSWILSLIMRLVHIAKCTQHAYFTDVKQNKSSCSHTSQSSNNFFAARINIWIHLKRRQQLQKDKQQQIFTLSWEEMRKINRNRWFAFII